jgi:hypothetical protein
MEESKVRARSAVLGGLVLGNILAVLIKAAELGYFFETLTALGLVWVAYRFYKIMREAW